MNSWMLYATLVTLLLGAAAWSLERTLPRFPLRWIWAAALGASFTVPLFNRVEPAVSSDPIELGPSAVAASELSSQPAADEPLLPPPAPGLTGRLRRWWAAPTLPGHLDRWASLTWVLLSLGAAGAAVRSSAVLRKERRSWSTQRIDGRDVFVTEDVGPAVVGIVRPAIVLPRWALEVPRRDRELILLHEEEHLGARDPQLLFAALVLLVLLPWNLPLWWQARRLRMAAEVDCDRRVLRRSNELRRYATLLVQMSRRGTLARLRAVGLVHPVPVLEWRIRTMISGSRPKRAVTTALALSTCVLAAAAFKLGAPVAVTGAQTSSPTSSVRAAPGAVSAAPSPVQGASDVVERQAASPSPEPAAEHAQRQVVGRITGRVTDAASGAPLQYVQVYIRDESLGTLTRATGAFEITGVPAGTYELRAERLGLTVASSEVVVPDGGTAEANFQLRARVIGLDEIISDSVSTPTPLPPRAAPAPTRSPNVPPGTPLFTPFTVPPRVTNAFDVRMALRRGYPTELRDAGIGGTVFVNVFVDVTGQPRNKVIGRSSGSQRLDEVALAAVDEIRFSPGLNRDQTVAVWVTFPLTFRP
jgi:TonB family protein